MGLVCGVRSQSYLALWNEPSNKATRLHSAPPIPVVVVLRWPLSSWSQQMKEMGEGRKGEWEKGIGRREGKREEVQVCQVPT